MEEKRYELRILPMFEKDLDEIVQYISVRLRNPDAADKLIDEVEEAVYKRLPIAEAFEPYRGIVKRQYPYYLDQGRQLRGVLCGDRKRYRYGGSPDLLQKTQYEKAPLRNCAESVL